MVIIRNYPKFFNHHLPIQVKVDLSDLQDNMSSITYISYEGRMLRESDSLDEKAKFLVSWASEIFPQWGTWMQVTLPGSKVSIKASTLRLVNKFHEMK